MNKHKKFMILVTISSLLLAMVVVFSACAPAPMLEEKEIKIGCQLALTGPAASTSVPADEGILDYLAYFNDTGGIDGIPIKYFWEDNQANTPRGILAYRKLGTLRNGASFAPWLLQLARRRAVELSRQQAKRRSETIPGDLANASSDGQLDEVTKEVFAAVDCLPRRQREAVLHRHCDGLSVQETARAMGIAVGTVTKSLSRAYARLRQILSAEKDP